MKNFKTRALAIVLAVAFVLAIAIVSVSAGASQSAWYRKAVEYLDGLGISAIGSDGDAPLSRDEFVMWAAKVESHQTITDAWDVQAYKDIASQKFNDVSESPYQGAIAYSLGRPLIEGYGDGTFKPAQQITLAEAAIILDRLMRFEDKVEMSETRWAHNALAVAQYWFSAFDATFLAESETYDPAYQLTKGEGAYLIYTIINGSLYENGYDADATGVRYTSDGMDLGAAFANSTTAVVKADFVVAEVPLTYTNLTVAYRRTDTDMAGANYDSLFSGHMYQTNSFIDKSGVVVLANLATGSTVTIPAAAFSDLVKEATGTEDDPSDATLYAEKGSVVTLSVTKDNKDILTEGGYIGRPASVLAGFSIRDRLVVDTYIGYAAATTANVRKGTAAIGWWYLSSSTAGSSSYARLTNEKVGWTNVEYKADGVTVKSADLVVNGTTYSVVTSYTGAANEVKVYAPEGTMDSTAAITVSVVGYVGDKVYEGAYFNDNQKAILLAHGDYASNFDGNIVTKTFEIESYIPSGVAYELVVEGGAFVTNASFDIFSKFLVDGRLDQNAIDVENPLTVAEAYQLILAPAQGESNVIFSDTDNDGYYDVAVVTESSRALYYGGVNKSHDPASEGDMAGADAYTKEIYDSFGNFILSAQGLKGHGVGGLVVDKTVAFGGTTGGGTDGWNTTSSTASNKVQLVVVASNERRLYGGPNDTNTYGLSTIYPYKTVDVAALTTGYIENVAAGTVKVDGVVCYAAEVLTAAGERVKLYIPVNPENTIDLDVTVDGVTSTLTFEAGRELLSFVTDHVSDDEIGTVQAGSWMAGHSVKYVAAENGVVWCMIETAVSGAVRGYVAGVTKTEDGDNSYQVTVVSTGNYAAKSEVAGEVPSYDLFKERLRNGASNSLILASFGIDVFFEDDLPIELYQLTNFFPVVAGSAAQNLLKVMNGLGAYGVQVGGLYYDTADNMPDGDTVPTLQQSTQHNAANGGANPQIFKAGSLLDVSDVEYFAKPQYKGYVSVDVLGVTIDANNFEDYELFTEVDGDYVLATAFDADAEYYGQIFKKVSTTSGAMFGFLKDADWTPIVRNGVGGNITNVEVTTTTTSYELATDADFDTETIPTWKAGVEYYTEDGGNYTPVDTSTTTYDATVTYYLANTGAAAASYVEATADDFDTTTIPTWKSGVVYYTEDNGNYTAVDTSTATYDATIGYFLETTTTTTSTQKGVITSSTSYTTGTSVKTLDVTGSSTAVWTYGAETYKVVHNLLVDRKLYNVDAAENGEKVDGGDLVYISLSKGAYNKYYTIEGLDYDAYDVAYVGSGSSTMLSDINNAGYLQMRGVFINDNVTRAGYRSDTYFYVERDLYEVGAALNWTAGGVKDALLGVFDNAYILGFAKVSGTTQNIIDNSQTVIGISDEYNMVVGYNPYYLRTVSSTGKITYTVMFSTVESLEGVVGSKYYQIDRSKTDLVEVREGENTANQRKDDGVSYTDTTVYYVDGDGYVWWILNRAVYDTTKFVSDEPSYDRTNATVADVKYDVALKDVGVSVATKDLVSLTVNPFVKGEDGYAPALYHVNLKNGLNTSKSFQMLQTTKIVVITPVSNTSDGKTDNSNFKITVTSPKELAANNQGIFVTDYQYNGSATTGTMLSVFGEIVSLNKEGTTPTQPVDPTFKLEPTIKGSAKLVYLNADAGIIAEAVQLNNFWVIRSTGSAIDVVTGEEIGSIQYVFGTYTSRGIIDATQASVAEGGYFLVDSNNEVIVKVDEKTPGTYGTEDKNIKVVAGTITAAETSGKTVATVGGVAGVDVSKYAFKFIYHDLDGNRFGVGGSNTNVSVSTESEIVAAYKSSSDIVAEGVGGSHMYTEEDVAEAQAKIDAAKEAVVDAYFNGTFWNVAMSPVNNYMSIQAASYQNPNATLGFNYVVIGNTFYVFVNSFSK